MHINNNIKIVLKRKKYNNNKNLYSFLENACRYIFIIRINVESLEKNPWFIEIYSGRSCLYCVIVDLSCRFCYFMFYCFSSPNAYIFWILEDTLYKCI